MDKDIYDYFDQVDATIFTMNAFRKPNNLKAAKEFVERWLREIERIEQFIPQKTKSLCKGCHDNFYNQPGNSINGVCWSFENAIVVQRKEVHINDRPPWNTQPIFTVLSCYRKPKYVYVKPHRER